MHSSLHEGAPIDSRCVFGLNKGGLCGMPLQPSAALTTSPGPCLPGVAGLFTGALPIIPGIFSPNPCRTIGV